MKTLVLGLVAASLVLASVAADAQTPGRLQAIAAVKQWPLDVSGNPMPNAQNKCPAPWEYAQTTIMLRGANGVAFPYTKRFCRYIGL